MIRKEARIVCILLAFMLILPAVTAESIDDEIKKITYYAQEYESGNINYMQLLTYSSAVKEKINSIMGATSGENGGALKEEKLRELLGTPTEETKWVFVEKEEREKNIDEYVPVWKKVIFDGNKIQIRLNAWPTIMINQNQEEMLYRLNFEVNFKSLKEKINFQEKISEIKSLAEIYNKDPTTANGEKLAEKSVSTEKAFEKYYRQNPGKCEDLMNSIFGSENKKSDQKMLVKEISFYQGENFEVIMRLEMCEDCEWHWISVNMNVEGRGPGFKMEQGGMGNYDQKQYEGMSDAEFESAIKATLESIRTSLEAGDTKTAFSKRDELSAINEAWNQKSNNVWQEANKLFEEKEKSMRDNKNQNNGENYWWIKLDQEKKQKAEEMSKANYEKRKQFYSELFSSYDLRELYFEQKQYELRLLEELLTIGKEICNNGVDDNKDNNIDCADDLCGGKICGQETVKVEENNETKEITKKLYCIAGNCQAKEEIIEIKEEFCGNHICESNETNETCAEDCNLCPAYSPLNCSGKVIFSGQDAGGCPLEPICINENSSCQVNEDCAQPLCGKAECMEGSCQTIKLEECREAECRDGAEKVQNCANGEKFVVEKCIDSVWISTGVSCTEVTGNDSGNIEGPPIISENTTVTIETPTTGQGCSVKEDCGNENDVCSNGECITIPYVAEQPESQETEEEPTTETPTTEGTTEEETQEQTEQPQESSESSGETSQESQSSDTTSESTSSETGSTESSSSGGESSSSAPAESSPAPEAAPAPSPEPSVTGQIIKMFSITGNAVKRITGAVIGSIRINEDAAPPAETPPAESPPAETPSSDSTPTSDTTTPGDTTSTDNTGSDTANPEGNPLVEVVQQPGEQPQDGTQPPQNNPPQNPGESQPPQNQQINQQPRNDYQGERRDKKQDQAKMCNEQCDRGCNERLVTPCVDKCARDTECEDSTCVDNAIKECETKCKSEADLGSCKTDCLEKCKSNKMDEFWEENKNEMEKNQKAMEKNVFQAGGMCRTNQQKTEGFIYFDGWGENFEKLRSLKPKYYTGGQSDWCKEDFENLQAQRKEFEKGFNQEFVTWFFEKHLANSAEDWQQKVSGIYELYWKDVDNSRETAFRMQCMGLEAAPQGNLINVKYETEFGSIEFWEELKTIKLEGMDKEVQIISPYMKVWIFPPQAFMEYEMKKAMKNHEFPGKSEDKIERKQENGPTEEEKTMLKQDEKFMKKLKTITDKYNGKFSAAVQFKNYDTNEIVFNIYVQVDENDLIQMKPMLPEETPQTDAVLEIDFKKIYAMIYSNEKDMNGARTESPPWDKSVRPVQKVKEIVDGAKMYLKVRGILSSAKITPEDKSSDVKYLMNYFMKMMQKQDPNKNAEPGQDQNKEQGTSADDVFGSKEQITGEVISLIN